jgi:DNA polymerase III alpha subunit
MRQVFRRFRNHSNEMMAHLTLEDFEGSISILIPPSLYRQHYKAFQQPGPFLIEGIVENDLKRNRTNMIAINIQLLQ